jgi:aarF domain-containing kinase
MATLVRPPALHICAVSGAGGGKEKWAPLPQRSWWGRNKPSLPRQPRQSGGNGGRGGGGEALDQVLGVLRRDGEFLQAAAGAPLRDVFWLRFLEKKQQQRKQPKPKPKPAQQQQMLQQEEVEVEELPREAPAFPPPAYQPGSSQATRTHLNLNPLHAHRPADDPFLRDFARVVVRGANGGRFPSSQGVRR